MKRVLSLTIVALAASMPSANAFAALQGSKHDFTSSGDSTGKGYNQTTNLCATCHVPHKPKRNTPLWAHNLTNTNFNLYNTNADYQGGNSAAYDTSPSALVGSSSQLCLSCHDGTLASVGTVTLSELDTSWILWNNGSPVAAVNATDGLKGSHPIGVNYSTVLANKPMDFNNISTDPDIKLENNNVQCASCHTPHSTTNPKFLRKPNNGSLCTTCHSK